jgi:hypothetical protein
MADISTQVSNRIAWARFAEASHRIHGASVESTLAALYDGIDGFDGDKIGEVLAALAARLGISTEEMRAGELALAAELADDDEHRDQRDEIVEQLRGELFEGRDAIERGFGEGAASAYGLDGTPPRQPDSLLAYAENAINLLQQTPKSDTDVFGIAIDTNKVAGRLEQSHAKLEAALDQLDEETRKAHTARVARDEAVDEWTEVFRGTARVLSGMYLLAGRKDLAERVRPRVRRSSGATEPPEDVEDALDGLDEPDDNQPDADAPADTDTPADTDVDEPVEA